MRTKYRQLPATYGPKSTFIYIVRALLRPVKVYADADSLTGPKIDDIVYYLSIEYPQKVIFSVAECNLQRMKG